MKLIWPSYEILTSIDGSEILKTIELAGRTCYKSECRITDDSAAKFVKMLVGNHHLSVIEHVSLSVRFIVDRGISHELVRHRICSISQESTRYIRHDRGVTFIIPSWLDLDPTELDSADTQWLLMDDYESETWVWMQSMARSEQAYLDLLERGWSPQQARSVLPNSLKTELVVTANLREWRHILEMRCAFAAHPQMREVMLPLRDQLRREIPVVFDY